MSEAKLPQRGSAEDGQAWPAASMKDVTARLCAPGAPFEMDTVTIDGVPTRVWKNAPEHLAALAQIGRSHGDKEFLVYEDERVTFDGWFKAVCTLADALQRIGVVKGDRVALAMRNLPEWPVIFFAATSIGAIVVPLNAWWTGQELAYGLADSGAKILFCDGERWERIVPYRDELPGLEQTYVSRIAGDLSGASLLSSLIGEPANYASLAECLPPDVDLNADDNATIFYTSGTTGKPKGALGTHRNLITNIFSTTFGVARSALRRGDPLPGPRPNIGLLVIPLFHVTACSARLMNAIYGGQKIIFMYKWDAVKAFQIIEREGVTSTGGVPTIAWQLLEHPDRHKYDLSSLNAVAYGGAPAAPELVRKIQAEFGAVPGQGWGMTETMATVTSNSAEDYVNRPDSCGAPVAVSDLKVMSADGSQELPIGDVGELWARGPQIVRGYWNKPEATAETFVGGWVRTGDLARLDDEGFCYIVDRAKDIIIRGGENIYSIEIEDALYEHPAVTDAAVVSVPHRTLGEEPVAAVQLAVGAEVSEDELMDWVRARLAAFKVPIKIQMSEDTLPRNANGKILKSDVRALFK